ncbi:MAG: leucine-rich repeat domain-containing protein, partial [Clostridia bacterium]|nr:leucine-rich repeat domain-containing protein [Clostridia bacterium]
WNSSNSPVYWGFVGYVTDNQGINYLVSANGAIVLSYNGNQASVVIPAEIDGYAVTEVGNNAFKNNNTITSVTIPDSVTKIGDYAFENCYNLANVTFGENSQLEGIGACAFRGCGNLASISIPDSVTRIGGEAFYDCNSLDSVYITNLTAWCNISFNDYGSNPLCNYADLYLNGAKVANLEIPTGITKIKSYAFYYCDNITSVTIPDSVTSIGDHAFYNCNKLTSIVIPDSVTSIDYSAFSACYKLTIYCEATNQPNGWDYDWNSNNRPVYWYSETQPATTGNWWHYVDGVVTKW